MPEMRETDVKKIVVSAIFDHFDGECLPDQEDVAGLVMADVSMSQDWVTLFGHDRETGQEFRAVIRVAVNFTGSDQRNEP